MQNAIQKAIEARSKELGIKPNNKPVTIQNPAYEVRKNMTEKRKYTLGDLKPKFMFP